MSQHHVISGLVWARPGEGPGFAPTRARGAKAKGLGYERSLGAALGPKVLHGQWFQFQDRSGLGWAQPDFLLEWAAVQREMVILEAKYTWVAEGHSQGELLYRPLVEKVFGCPARVVVVCKVLTEATPKNRIFSSLEEAIEGAALRSTVCHWIGVGPLWRTSRLAPAPRPLHAATIHV